LSQVRAGNLSELVYKQGQAGISKASVTIVFNNEDDNCSPVGYEQCPEVTVTRQVLIGGKSKYLINGRVSPAGQVANLFHSVQLNVNNPHFLIMQGRITKVLNMKPNEILGMVEEASGTRMYENKKTVAIRTIEKKEKKVKEINSVLSEEITPTLERLRGEKQHYLKWSKNNADIERIERFVVASEYCKSQETLATKESEIAKMEDEVKQHEDVATACQEEISIKENEINDLSSQLSGDFGGSHKNAKQIEEDLSKQLVKTTSAWKNSLNTTSNAVDDVKAAKALVKETKDAIKAKNKEIQKDSDQANQAQQDALKAEKDVERLTMEYQNMCAGISSSESDEGLTLPDQISKAHSDANNADAKTKQAKMKIKHLNKTIKTVEKEMKKEEKSSTTLATKRAKVSGKLDKMKSELSLTNFSPSEFNRLESEKVQVEDSLSSVQEVVDTLTAQLQGRLAFKYSDPVRGFDRNKVKGMVAKLVSIHRPEHATALEVVAGGKLYQIVVDEAITGKALLSRGKLQRRVTIIPLDKITSKRITNSTINKAQSMAQRMDATASPAIELVGFDEEVRNAIEYVFGSTLVVDTMDAANKICDATKTRTVTLDGDVYDPSGTISGGSKNNLGTTLAKLTELTTASNELKEKKGRLKQINADLKSMKTESNMFESLTQKIELSTAELSSIEKHISQTTYGMLFEKFSAMQKEIDEATSEEKEMEVEKDMKWKLYNELKGKELELTNNREKKLKHIDKKVQDAKRAYAKYSTKAREADSASQTLTLELESLKAEVAASDEAVVAAEKALKEVTDAESDLQMKVGDIKAKYDTAKIELVEIEKQMSVCSSSLKKLGKQKATLIKKLESAQLNAKKSSIKLSKYNKDTVNAEKVIAFMMKKYPWIETEKEAFGVKGGEYDFEATESSEMSDQLKFLESEQTTLAKKINKKVMGMIEKAETEYSELLRKRKVVENDKKKIQSVIEELDVKKKSELERTWVKVNRDFGSVFSTLLPGTSAKLEPPAGLQAWEGLEVKVAFGDVWKESLTELSGGQRSLLALSLILSLLLFKPAPMYILDEVDAALDLSHTQNIGNMLKTHFSQSQFIVVSLKEGMFNNANVIFRTKFVDGVSTVTRTIGVGASSKARALQQQNNENRQIEDTAARKRKSRGRRRTTGKEN